MNVYHIGRTYSMWMMWRWSRSYEQEAGEGFVSYFALRNCCKLIMEVESIVHSIQGEYALEENTVNRIPLC